MVFARFMSGTAGRLIRAIAGILLIVLGFFVIGGTVGTIVGVVGFVPLAAGIFNFCLLGPVFGGYFSGRQSMRS